LQQLGAFIAVVTRLRDVAFDPQVAGMVAVGAIKDETGMKPADAVKTLEELLAQTKSLGLRNAIRMSLKDLYKSQGELEKMRQTLLEMVAENDAAIQAKSAK